MKIAILGATSQIARDLITSFSAESDKQLYLFARCTDNVTSWLESARLAGRYHANEFSEFAKHEFDAVINFVGVGNPAQAVAMGNSIFDVTLRFDEMALEYLKLHPRCRYIFLSSGAAYGSSFDEPVNQNTKATVEINNLSPHEWYGIAKLHAECRHRARSEFSIFDVRVFNYFSRTQDISARFLITDILRAINKNTVLSTSPDYIVRDFLHPIDFHNMISSLLKTAPANAAVDCYSKAPIDKPTLLATMQNEFGLKFQLTKTGSSVNATGGKPYYYSLNRRAADFGYQPTLTSLEGIIKEVQSMHLSNLHRVRSHE